MPKLVSTEDLKDTLAKYTAKGDTHWALKGEIPTDEEIRVMVDVALDEADVVTHPEVSDLSSTDISDILAEAH